MTEATDEEVRECNNWLEKLRYRAASEPTGTLRVTVEQLNDIHTEYRKLLARLERVERELRVMQCGAQEARSLNKQPG